MPDQAADAALTEDQAAVYDRQLRVWGVEVQRKLTAARVLLVGFGQLAAEVAKNITLAGVGQVSLLDDTPAAEHVGRNFLVPAAAPAGQTAAEAAAGVLGAMNPLVRVAAAPGSVDGGAAAAALAGHDLVVAVGLPPTRAAALCADARAAGVAFMAAAAHGACGWAFADLGDAFIFTAKGGGGERCLQYWPLADALAEPAAPLPPSTHALTLVLLACAALERELGRALGPGDLAAAEERLARLTPPGSAQLALARALLPDVAGAAPELAPVAAVLGGLLANSVLAAVSGSGAPLHNLLLFCLHDGRAIVETQPAAAAAAAAAGGAGGQLKQQAQAQEQAVEID
ncbi:SAE1A [Scenedesmus sp. PABB004]|nr:SAE1A [Scenedesmus sp. PABB004]